MSFRIQTRNVFLTYPRCNIPKEVACAQLVAKFEQQHQLKWCVVAHELHVDDGNQEQDLVKDHLHAVIQFQKPFQTRDKLFFDLKDEESGTVYHGNYQASRSWRVTLEYTVKDCDIVILPEGTSYEDIVKGKKQTMADRVATLVLAGESVREIRNEEPGFYMMNKRQILELEAELQQEARLAQLKPWVPVEIPTVWAMPTQTIAQWLNDNISKPREFKQKQLWIWSYLPNMGKTSLINALEKYCDIFNMGHENYFNGFTDEATLICFDEFNAQHNISFMNSFVQGRPVPVPTKGGQVWKTKNTPVIVLANRPPHEAYCKTDAVKLQPLISRFTVVELNHHIFPLIDTLNTDIELPSTQEVQDFISVLNDIGDNQQGGASAATTTTTTTTTTNNIYCLGNCGEDSDCIYCAPTLSDPGSPPNGQENMRFV